MTNFDTSDNYTTNTNTTTNTKHQQRCSMLPPTFEMIQISTSGVNYNTVHTQISCDWKITIYNLTQFN